MNKLLSLILTLSFFSLDAQSFDFYNKLFDKNQDSALLLLEEEGFEVIDIREEDGCVGYGLKRDSSSIVYNICDDEEGDIKNLNIIERNLEPVALRLFDLQKDASFSQELTTIGKNNAFVFTSDEKEIYFIFNHFIEMYIMEISNVLRFEDMKEMYEENFEYNAETDGVAMFRNILNATNSKGESTESLLKDLDIKSDFNVLEIDKASSYLLEVRQSENFQTMKKIVDNHLLSDPSYVETIQNSLFGLNLWLSDVNNYYEGYEDKVFMIALERNLFKSIVMLDYVIKSVGK